MKVLITLQNTEFGTCMAEKTIDVDHDYLNDKDFISIFNEYKDMARKHNFKMSTEDINDHVSVVFEAQDPRDRELVDKLNELV